MENADDHTATDAAARLQARRARRAEEMHEHRFMTWWRAHARRLIAGALIGALVVDLVQATQVVDAAAAGGASAVQVIQVYSAHTYTAVVLIGIAFALYVWTRDWDRPGI